MYVKQNLLFHCAKIYQKDKKVMKVNIHSCIRFFYSRRKCVSREHVLRILLDHFRRVPEKPSTIIPCSLTPHTVPYYLYVIVLVA